MMMVINKKWAVLAVGALLGASAQAQAGWSWIQANACPLQSGVYDPHTDRVLTLDPFLRNVNGHATPWPHHFWCTWEQGCEWEALDFAQGAWLPTVDDGVFYAGPSSNSYAGSCYGGFTKDYVYFDNRLQQWKTISWDWSTTMIAGNPLAYPGTYSWPTAVTCRTESWGGAGFVSDGVHSVTLEDLSGFMFHDGQSDRIYVNKGRDWISWADGDPAWTWHYPLVGPNAGGVHVHDTVRGRIVRLELTAGAPAIWEYDIALNNWFERVGMIPSGFTPRSGAAIAFHPPTGNVVIYGGDTGGGVLGDVWHYDGQTFYQAVTGSGPALRRNAHMVYRSATQEMIMWGGENPGPLYDTWSYVPGVQTVAYQSFGAGCSGTAGIPTLVATPGSLPFAGQPFTVNVQNIPFFTSCFMGMGFSTTSYNGAALPLDLTVLNMPGCTLYTSVDWGVIPTANVLGTAVWTFQIPPGVGGATFYNQAVVFDPLANQAGLTVSNAAEATVGY